MAHIGALMKGMKEINKMFDDEINRVKRNRKQSMIDACEMLIADIKTSMINTTHRGHNPIIKTKSGKPHWPSVEYKPPAVMDSNLIKSIRYIIYETKTSVFGDVGSYNVPYAAALEWGYAPRGLLPRPWLKPSIERKQEIIFQRFGIKLMGVRYLT